MGLEKYIWKLYANGDIRCMEIRRIEEISREEAVREKVSLSTEL